MNNQKGFAILYLSILILTVALVLSGTIFFVTFSEQRIAKNITASSQVFYMAETGIEDAILRIKKSMPISSNYEMNLSGGTVNVSISTPNPSTKIITALAIKNNVSKKLEAQLSIQSISPEFFYGAQVGDLGIIMENNSRIEGSGGAPGNVYSNGPVSGSSGSTVTGDVLVATGMTIDNVVVYGDAHANTITDSNICGNAFYQTIDSDSLSFLNNPRNPICLNPLTPGTANPGSADPPLQNMPISDSNINQWKDEATVGGIYSGNFNASSSTSLGPKKINGNLIMTSTNKTLTVTGTIYVTGYIDIDNGSRIRCDTSYGLNSCIVIADKWIHIENNGVFQGSGQPGSYIMILSTSNCDGSSSVDCTNHNAAMDLRNGATGAIFYANDGLIYLHNGVIVSEIVARKIDLEQGAIVRYEQGLVNANFSSGPGGSWQVDYWKETE